MDKIELHSDTWRATSEWLQRRRENAIISLINGTRTDDKLRGKIELIDDLIAFAKNQDEIRINPEIENLRSGDY
jgi:hypothetical protein